MHVERVGFAPMKGGRHLAQDGVRLAAGGPVGDREFCLVDPVRDAVLRTVENPSLLRVVTRWEDGLLSVSLPTGLLEGVPEGTGSVRSVDYWGREARVEVVAGPWAAGFSHFLGQEVLVARAAPGEVVYGAPVSLVTTGALRWLGRRVGHDVEPERFRATILVDSGLQAAPAERSWVGCELDVGEARLEVVGEISRCAVIDLDPATGRRDSSLLAALAARDGRVAFGVEAVVARPGLVRAGDDVALRGRMPAGASRAD